MIDDKQLAEWKRLADEATKGPWNEEGPFGGRYHYGIDSDDGRICDVLCDCDDGCRDEADGKFIAAAREAVPDLVAEVERLRKGLRAICDRQEKWNNQDDVSGIECVVDMGSAADNMLAGREWDDDGQDVSP